MCKGFRSPASDHFANNLYKLEAELSSTQSSLASSPCTYSGMRDTTSVWSSHPCEGCKMAVIFFTTGIFFYASRSLTPSIPSHLWWQNEERVSFVELSWDLHLPACTLDFGGLLLICFFLALAAAGCCQLFLLLGAVAVGLFTPKRALLVQFHPCRTHVKHRQTSMAAQFSIYLSCCSIYQFDQIFLGLLAILHISSCRSPVSFLLLLTNKTLNSFMPPGQISPPALSSCFSKPLINIFSHTHPKLVPQVPPI